MRSRVTSAVKLSLAAVLAFTVVLPVAEPAVAAGTSSTTLAKLKAAQAKKVTAKKVVVKKKVVKKAPVKVVKPAVPVVKRPAGPVVTDSAPSLSATDAKMVSLVNDLMVTMRQLKPAGTKAGVWRTPVVCWRCDAGPAAAMASASVLTGDVASRTEAIQIFDNMIADYQQPNGSFYGTTGSADIDTMFFTAELGTTAIALKPYLGAERTARWTAGVKGAADFLVANKNLSWYTNGNINIGNTLVFALAYRLTGDSRYLTHYETALQFTISPPQPRWAGYGLFVTKQPTTADGSDGKAYFAEAGAGGIGYDPEYTVLQLDMLTKLWLVNQDARVLRLMNMATNQLLDRINTSSWMLDASRGTRKTDAVRSVWFDSAGIQVLAGMGGRTDLAGYAPAQLAAIDRAYRSDIPGLGDRAKYALGMTVPSVLAGQRANAQLR